jgi:hypothetical protein
MHAQNALNDLKRMLTNISPNIKNYFISYSSSYVIYPYRLGLCKNLGEEYIMLKLL